MVKNRPANAADAGDAGLISGSGRSPAVGNGNPLQYSCLENSMDIGEWRVIVHGGHKELDTTDSAIEHTAAPLSRINTNFNVTNPYIIPEDSTSPISLLSV